MDSGVTQEAVRLRPAPGAKLAEWNFDQDYHPTAADVAEFNVRQKVENDRHRRRQMNENPHSIEMPRYRSHKIVHALKLTDIERNNDTGVVKVTPEDKRYAPFYPVEEWYARFKGSDEDTGYYVVYDGGYASWSPSKAFEEGYTRV